MANHLGRAQLTAERSSGAPPLFSSHPFLLPALQCFLVDFGLTCAWNSPEIDVVYLLGAVEKLPSCTVAQLQLYLQQICKQGESKRGAGSAQRSKAREMCFNNLPAI